MRIKWIGHAGLYPLQGFELSWVWPEAEFEVEEGRALELIEAGAAEATVIGAAYEEDE